MKRLVVKIGSSTLVKPEGGIDREWLGDLAEQVAHVREAGWQVVIVSSGAIAFGVERLGLSERPSDVPGLQAAASVGQPAFAAAYADAFDRFGIVTSLVLLTRRDTADRQAYLHARDTLGRLLDLGVVPIVNENDTVSVEQIRFGDNDTLSALVACLVGADLDIILSDVEGLYTANPVKDPSATLVERVERIDDAVLAAAGEAGTAMGSGGMVTKIKAARVLGAAGIPLVVCSGHRAHAVEDAAAGKSVGTLFSASQRAHEVTPRKLWIALGDAARGAICVDDGARKALIERGSSLLAVGIAQVRGDFAADDIVDILDGSGHLFARGRVAFSSDEVELACGRTQQELAGNRLLAVMAERPVIHRDDLIVFE